MTTLRICEWGRLELKGRVSIMARRALAEAAEGWRAANRLPAPPLSFSGPDGATLCADRWVGVVEAADVRVEILPKLDRALLDADIPADATQCRSVMRNLLWLLAESQHGDLVEEGDAQLADASDSFCDLLAWLFARRLRREFEAGLTMDYVRHADDLPVLRGRIDLTRQATRLFGRPDRLACRWEEFSADIVLNRLLRAAVERVLMRTMLPAARGELESCRAWLEDAESVSPGEALVQATKLRWSRSNERFRPCAELSVAFLRGSAKALHAGGTSSFVFLLNMAQVFQDFVAVSLERAFSGPVQREPFVRCLLNRRPGGIEQYPDFVWHDRAGGLWVGDAKYKLAPQTSQLDPADVRQLICYGQLASRVGNKESNERRLVLLYPVLTSVTERIEFCRTFDGAWFAAVPVCVLPMGAVIHPQMSQVGRERVHDFALGLAL